MRRAAGVQVVPTMAADSAWCEYPTPGVLWKRDRLQHSILGMSLSDLTDLDAQRLGLRKSFSIDSSLSCVSHHATPRAHENRPQEQRGKGMGLSGLNTLHEDRERSPPATATPQSPLPMPPPPLAPTSPRPEFVTVTTQQPRQPLLRGALLVAATAVCLMACAIAVAPTALSHALALSRDYHAARRPAMGNHTQIAAGCSNVDAIPDFDLSKFTGDWHHIAWLHYTSEAAAWEKKVGQQCTTAAFMPQQRRRRATKRQPPVSARNCSDSSGGGNLGSGANSSGGCSVRNSGGGGNKTAAGASGEAFDVTFTHRLLRTSETSAKAGGTAPAPAVNLMQGQGSTPEATAPGKLQVQLQSGHVLPFWVVATDYSSWALMCTTSASLGGGQPAQVLALLSRSWMQDRLDIGDRLNELADRNLPWKEVVFAPSAACAAAASAGASHTATV